MKNRLYGFLMLFIPFLILGGLYYYYKVLNIGSITINSNVGDYQISLYSKALRVSFKTDCENNKCELLDIAPVGYALTISKDGYDSILKNIELGKKQNLVLDFELQKTKYLKIVNSDFVTQNLFGKYYKYFYLDDTLYYFIQDESNKNILTLYKQNLDKTTKLYTFIKTDKNNIFIDKVYGNDRYIYIKYDNKDYIYDLKNYSIKGFKNNYDINYVKYDNSKLIFILDLGVFYCDVDLKNIENIGIFNDFITSNIYGYIFYVDKDDEKNLEKYNLDNSKSYFLSYDIPTKTSNVIFSTNKNIKKIYRNSENIYISDGDNFYQVINLE